MAYSYEVLLPQENFRRLRGNKSGRKPDEIYYKDSKETAQEPEGVQLNSRLYHSLTGLLNIGISTLKELLRQDDYNEEVHIATGQTFLIGDKLTIVHPCGQERPSS